MKKKFIRVHPVSALRQSDKSVAIVRASNILRLLYPSPPLPILQELAAAILGPDAQRIHLAPGQVEAARYAGSKKPAGLVALCEWR